MKRLLTFVILHSAFVIAAPAADIVALVIGNNAYQRVEDQLDTPVNDAQLMKRTLEALPGGADVKLLTDATKEDIQIALNALKVRAQGAKLALVFYSGHGMDGQPDGFPTEDTFLLPVDATIPDVNYLDTRAVSLSSVLTALKNAPVTARAVFLDCCRSGAPRATAALASNTKNFGDIDERVKAALGKAVVPDATLVAFAASPGRKAAAFLSESDENSPFTKFLTDELATGTGNLRDLVEAAAETTEVRTGKRQVPYVTYTGAASAIRQIVFRTSPVPLPVTTPAMTEAEIERRARELAARMAPSTPTAPSATKGFTNTLGMAFVPVPGTQVQFCVHETRVADFAAFVADSSSYDYSSGTEPFTLDSDGWKQRSGFSWKKPGFPQTDDHPVTCVSWEDAQAFCKWLSRKEGKTYRLPTDHEWSAAVGIGNREEASASPESKDDKIEAVYPWGGDFPPSSVVGNYGGEESKIGKESSSWTVISGYRDGHARTATVMSFTANKLGIHDLGGNLWEWCEDWYNAKQESRVLRGGSWGDISASGLLSSNRYIGLPGVRYDDYGFRLVLVVGSGG
jgi:formylglycine-generating enzyme required for sulfatase activity/uncharacterized caspase-like protein